MWVIALIGSATAFVESTLGQLFKQRQKDSFIGGPAYYIEKGLHKRWMAYLFAIVILGKYTFRLLDDYLAQKRRGIKEPTFHRSQFPEIQEELECWD